jgi:hypothetical protein
VEGNPLAFLLSWVLVYGALLACWLFLRKTLIWAARQPARSQDCDLIT